VNGKDSFGREVQRAAASEDHAVHGLAFDAVIHHAIVTSGTGTLSELTPKHDTVATFFVFARYGKQSAEDHAQFTTFELDRAREAGDEGAGFVALVESGSESIAGPGILEARGKKFGGVEKALLAVFLPGFLDQTGNLSKIAPKILYLKNGSLRSFQDFVLHLDVPTNPADSYLDAGGAKHGGEGGRGCDLRTLLGIKVTAQSRRGVQAMALFSIIITSHNQASFIRNAVDSAVAQKYADKEIIVVDDASSDGSQGILEGYGDRIRLVKVEKNAGTSRARNIGIAAAKGDFLVFLDGDDVFFPWALEMYGEIVEREQPQIILTTMRWFEGQAPDVSKDRKPRHAEVVAYESLLEKDRPYRASASALVIRREVFTRVRGWTTEIFPMEDLDVLIKLLQSGRTAQILAPATVCYRIHAANTIHQVANCASALRLIMQKEKRGDYAAAPSKRGQRYAFLGGPILFWIKKTYKNRLYREAFGLLASGWPMIFAAGLRRVAIALRGKRSVQTIAL